jgi:lipid-binding SYLF domain-containing protein
VKLGGDASAVAGPIGPDASAETDVTARTEILSYSRARGLFAHVSPQGSTIRPDNDANDKIYGRDIPAKEIALSGASACTCRVIDFYSERKNTEAHILGHANEKRVNFP